MPRDEVYKFHKEKTVFNVNQNQNDAPFMTADFQNDVVMTDKIAETMKMKEPIDGLAVNAYGDKFKDVYDDETRQKQIKTSGSELYVKAENARLLKGADAEYRKQLGKVVKEVRGKKDFRALNMDEDTLKDFSHLFRHDDTKFDLQLLKDYMGDDEARFAALDRVLEDFVNQNFSFDFSTDKSFARESLRLIQLHKRADSFLSLMNKNRDYWAAIDDASKSAVMKKLSQSDFLWDYFTNREKLMCDTYYETHLNREMAYSNFATTDMRKQRTYERVTKLLARSEKSYEYLKHMNEEDVDQKVEQAQAQKLNDQLYLENTAVPLHRTVHEKGRSFQWLDMFGAPLRFFSWLMRNKRSTDHGRKKYQKMAEDFDHKFPEEITSIGKTGHTFLRNVIDKSSNAPDIDLTPLFTDPIKLELSQTLDANYGLRLADKTTTRVLDDNESQGIFMRFYEAAQKYAAIGGIVNSDTTEMEMAFLDKMAELQSEMNEKFPAGVFSDETLIWKRTNTINQIMLKLNRALSGNLRENTDRDGFDVAVRNSVAIIQDTTITENIDESNIKNIPLFTHYPNINDIKQSTIGDCYLVGAMTSFVKTDPQAVMDMFQDLGDGNVLVRMYEGYSQGEKIKSGTDWMNARNVEMKPVYIKLRKHYETGDGNAGDCVWPQLIEKAYAVCGFNYKGESYVDEKGYLHKLEDEITNGDGYIALAHMSGTLTRRKSIRVRSVTKEQNQQGMREYNDMLYSDEFKHLLGAGIPTYMLDELYDNIGDNYLSMINTQALVEMFSQAISRIPEHFGTKLMQFKKNCMRKGLTSEQYAPLITSFAEGLGLELADDWDQQTQTSSTLVFGLGYTAQFDLNADNQTWFTMFKQNFAERYIEKFKDNIERIRTGRQVEFDTVNGRDYFMFQMDIIDQLLDNMNNVGDHPVGDLSKQEVIDGIKGEITYVLKHGGSEEAKQTHINAHKDLYRTELNNEETKKKLMRDMERMGLEYPDIIKENQVDFMIDLAKALKAGGSVEISIPHFVSAVGMAVKDNVYYVLIKDPFNVYNMTYNTETVEVEEQVEREVTKEVGKEKKKIKVKQVVTVKKKVDVEKKHEDGFLDVMSLEGHHINRHLDDDGDDDRSIYGGFRGLSYWKLDDLFAKMENYVPITPQDIKRK